MTTVGRHIRYIQYIISNANGKGLGYVSTTPVKRPTCLGLILKKIAQKTI